MSSTSRESAMAAQSLRANRYDKVSSLLISILILCGASVALLVVLWLGSPPEFARVFPPIGTGDVARNSKGLEPTFDLELPSLSELPQVAVGQPISELSTLLSHETIAAASMLDVDGLPSAKRPGGPALPDEAVPRWERWEIRYEASSLDGYARQLDFFGIELGAVGRKPLVDYASHFTNAPPMTRSSSGSDERRLYLTWRGGRLKALDRKLLEAAGVDVVGRELLQFYPQSVEDTLARLEQEYTKDGRVDKLRRTVFGVRRSQEGYEFYIIEQR